MFRSKLQVLMPLGLRCWDTHKTGMDPPSPGLSPSLWKDSEGPLKMRCVHRAEF